MASCGWCTTGHHGHPWHFRVPYPCTCTRCEMITHELHWRYVCDACGYHRSTTDENEAATVAARHEKECPMISDAWKVLDGYADELSNLKKGGAPEAAVVAMQERARGASAVLAVVLGLEPSSIGREAGRRFQLRAAGQEVDDRSAAELRTAFEPLGGAS